MASHIDQNADIFHKLKDFLSLYIFPLHDIMNDLINQKIVIDRYNLNLSCSDTEEKHSNVLKLTRQFSRLL